MFTNHLLWVCTRHINLTCTIILYFPILWMQRLGFRKVDCLAKDYSVIIVRTEKASLSEPQLLFSVSSTTHTLTIHTYTLSTPDTHTHTRAHTHTHLTPNKIYPSWTFDFCEGSLVSWALLLPVESKQYLRVSYATSSVSTWCMTKWEQCSGLYNSMILDTGWTGFTELVVLNPNSAVY